MAICKQSVQPYVRKSEYFHDWIRYRVPGMFPGALPF